MNRFWQWISLHETFDKQEEIVSAALKAVDGTDKVVNRHLLKIARREGDIADLLLIMSESKAFDIDVEE